jgi:hypothetical protein
MCKTLTGDLSKEGQNGKQLWQLHFEKIIQFGTRLGIPAGAYTTRALTDLQVGNKF